MMKELTQERLTQLLSYNHDSGLFTWIAKSSPNANNIKIGDIAGCLNHDGYRRIVIDGKKRPEHRLVWLYIYGAFPSGEKCFIDHMDMDKSNNQLSNLRVCTRSENGMNRSKLSNNSSGFVGVYFHKATGKYISQIVNPITRKREHLGLFDAAVDASVVYQKKAKEYHNEYFKDTLVKEELIVQ